MRKKEQIQESSLSILSSDVYDGRIRLENYSVKDGEDVIKKAIKEACGGEWDYYSFKDNQYKVFKVMAEVLSIATNKLVGNTFDPFIELHDTALGDTTEFIIEDNQLFEVGIIASGVNDLSRQKIYNKKLNLSIFELGVKVYEELDRFMSGRLNWKQVIDKVATSMQIKIGELCYKAIMDTYNVANHNLMTAGTFSEDKLSDLISSVEIETNQPCVIYGTKKALSKIKGAYEGMSEDMKTEVNKIGYLKNFYGTPCIELPQCYKSGKKEMLIEDNCLIIVPNGEKIVKLVLEGEPFIAETTDGIKRNDRQIEYLFTRKLGLAVLKANVYGIMKLA